MVNAACCHTRSVGSQRPKGREPTDRVWLTNPGDVALARDRSGVFTIDGRGRRPPRQPTFVYDSAEL